METHTMNLTCPFYAQSIPPSVLNHMHDILYPDSSGGFGKEMFDILSVVEGMRLPFKASKKRKKVNEAKPNSLPRNKVPDEEKVFFWYYRVLPPNSVQSKENKKHIRQYGNSQMQMICYRDHMTTCWRCSPPPPGGVADEDEEDEGAES